MDYQDIPEVLATTQTIIDTHLLIHIQDYIAHSPQKFNLQFNLQALQFGLQILQALQYNLQILQYNLELPKKAVQAEVKVLDQVKVLGRAKVLGQVKILGRVKVQIQVQVDLVREIKLEGVEIMNAVKIIADINV